MAELAKKLKYNGGQCSLYNTTSGFPNSSLYIACKDTAGTVGYAPLVATTDPTASKIKVKKNDTTYAVATTNVVAGSSSFAWGTNSTWTCPAGITKVQVTHVYGYSINTVQKEQRTATYIINVTPGKTYSIQNYKSFDHDELFVTHNSSGTRYYYSWHIAFGGVVILSGVYSDSYFYNYYQGAMGVSWSAAINAMSASYTA